MKYQLFCHRRLWWIHFGRWRPEWSIGRILDWQITIGPFTLRRWRPGEHRITVASLAAQAWRAARSGLRLDLTIAKTFLMCRTAPDYREALVQIAQCAVDAWDRYHDRAPVFAFTQRAVSFTCLSIMEWFPW